MTKLQWILPCPATTESIPGRSIPP